MTTRKFHCSTSSSSHYAVSPDETSLDISHELRTPLTVIQGALDLLGSGKLGSLSDQGQRMVKIAANNVERLMRLTAALEQESDCVVSLSSEELGRLRLERDLMLALPHRQLRLQYQPIVALNNGEVTGFEVLARWHHPTLGIVSPTQFIPLAEASGSIIDIGTWVIREACQQLQIWRQKFPAFNSLTISVNLSCHQIACPDLPEQIEQILQETGLSAQSLKLEITESSIMSNTDVIELVLSQLQVLGVQLYIDDFGTGYSSLSRLLELPLDVLKIDRSFVQQLSSERGEYLVRAIANLAQSLGIDVIAEGVETEEQALKLQSLGCHRGQGFLFARPLDSQGVPLLICPLPLPL
ncbi:MAG: EAL domain-containing protein [Pegethrix bostrychoides GSE-TBD4-15B]|jgi:EAL domain-containing protein (putative c-di-GMP-specific phosphodiesterase class I)|uniref:histidine kinase n=1 Tax=Pegethrix bostrychoides GSE-TBD4-15B TaxID=2839662 RepID=A0A951P802_9CYAN|nr:EAL domain-containing protein [Pegethrix bostrychoides GSE-TBD4-15B]